MTVFSPSQLTQRSEFYHQLGQMTMVGVSLVSSLEHLQQSPPASSYRAPIQQVLKHLATGSTFSESLAAVPNFLPEFDITLIQAGEKSGRIDHSFRMLSEYYAARAENTKHMVSSLIYPAFLLHLLVAVTTLVLFLWLRPLVFLPLVGLVLVYIGVIFMIYAGQSKHGEPWRAFIESALHPVPVLGTARHSLALARLSAALEALLSAGVSIIDAWEMAGVASGSPALRRTVIAWRPLLNAGHTPAEVLRTAPRFPELFKNQYASGEITGRLDDSMRRLHRYYQDEGSRKLKAVARWVPIFIYFAVALLIALFVFWFYLDVYPSILNRATGGEL